MKLTNEALINWLIFQRVDELDFGKFKTVRIDLNKLSDVVDTAFAKNRKFNTLKTKVSNLKKDINKSIQDG